MSCPEKPRQQKGYRRIIPSMNALVAFEAVARYESFTLAAQELGVSQAATSKHVKFLEDVLGTRLFERLPRSIKLTTAGALLFGAMDGSMQRIASAFDKITDGLHELSISLASSPDFSNLRVLPRLPLIKALMPGLKLRLTVNSDREADIWVRFGTGNWEGGESIFLFDEEIFPVCSPAWRDEHGAPASLEDLARAALIDTDATLEGWMTWHTWFRALGYAPSKLEFTLRSVLYGNTVQAALQGHGIALGWSRMLQSQLATGSLVRVSEHSIKLKDAYYLFLAAGRQRTAEVNGILQCLQSDVPLPSP
ncbi:LysR substrate-binding domain-containing protein [Pseudomonas sp. CC120222-01a]|uniref:LysR substrate-binding domain-containing protein n=1 Tax=Pseudomonas sp. CC120222-01a TaxID=1378075 RepID=UPI000D9DB438|nr:LysR substrate-binding domain-containing protein [Pseudomonas sp. CC120222-01a]PVZ41205.1 DNA-binding transcriptional LysR family regulator [Pseudomonas sp. CC120222-01a]